MKRTPITQICFLLLCLAKIQPSSAHQPKDDTGTWAFQKHETFSHNEEGGFARLKNLNFGPFGANKISLTFKCEACLEKLKKSVHIYLNNLGTAPSNPLLLDARKSGGGISDELEEMNILSFDLLPEDGVHDVYITFPEELKSSDLMSVQFFSAEPTRGQWYYLVVHANGKIFTGCNQGEYACAHILHSGKSQRVKFDKDPSGGYRIVSEYDGKVWSVKDASNEDKTILTPERFIDLPHQIWFIEEYDSAYRLHPKHNLTKCMDLSQANNDSGTKILSHQCNNTPAQTYNIIVAC